MDEFNYFFKYFMFVVLMVRFERFFNVIMFQKIGARAGIFSQNKITAFENIYSSVSNILQIANWCGNYIKLTIQ